MWGQHIQRDKRNWTLGGKVIHGPYHYDRMFEHRQVEWLGAVVHDHEIMSRRMHKEATNLVTKIKQPLERPHGVIFRCNGRQDQKGRSSHPRKK